jgi:hypothetical protein
MISHLYRFRPIENLLSKYDELQNQEVYFADPKELNDPMEGFREVFWHGDKIVWVNLFKHYLRCLDKAWAMLAFYGDGQSFGWDHIPVLHFADPSPNPQHKAMLDEIFSEFFKDDVINSLITDLADRNLPVRRHELSAYIRFLHLFAISVISRCHEKHNIAANVLKPELHEAFKKQPARLAEVFRGVKQLTEAHPDNAEGAIDAFFMSHRFLNDQMDFINQYNGTIDSCKANRIFVFVDFCSDYVRQLERLVYPDWYAACFMLGCRNASVWGSYGVRHTGACLKFKVTTTDGRPFIRLNRVCGWNSAGPLYGDMEHEFFNVDYETQHVAVDFFRSLARQPIPILSRYWYSDGEGGRSLCADPLSNSGGEWRKRYWSAFEKSIAIKLADWSYEQEYRLILTGDMLDLSEKKARKPKYDFNDLDGIIFGMETTSDKKREVCKIIEEKCRKVGRTDFKFYQAFYSREKRTIEHAEMGLVKFKP